MTQSVSGGLMPWGSQWKNLSLPTRGSPYSRAGTGQNRISRCPIPYLGGQVQPCLQQFFSTFINVDSLSSEAHVVKVKETGDRTVMSRHQVPVYRNILLDVFGDFPKGKLLHNIATPAPPLSLRTSHQVSRRGKAPGFGSLIWRGPSRTRLAGNRRMCLPALASVTGPWRGERL